MISILILSSCFARQRFGNVVHCRREQLTHYRIKQVKSLNISAEPE